MGDHRIPVRNATLALEDEWWQTNVIEDVCLADFKRWTGGPDAVSRVRARARIGSLLVSAPNISVLDVGCGFCVEGAGLKADFGDRVQYTGIDIVPSFIEQNCKNGYNCAYGSAEDAPYKDAAFDVVYARHVLESLHHWSTALDQFIRVASRKVVCIFFMPLYADETEESRTEHWGTGKMRVNKYSRPRIERALKQHAKVETFEWIPVQHETILDVTIRSAS